MEQEIKNYHFGFDIGLVIVVELDCGVDNKLWLVDLDWCGFLSLLHTIHTNNTMILI